MEPSPLCLSLFDAGRYSAGYGKGNLVTNTATKHSTYNLSCLEDVRTMVEQNWE